MEDEAKTSVVRKRVIAGAIALGTVLGAAGIAGAVTGQDDTTAPNTSSALQDDTTGTVEDESNEAESTEVEGDDDDAGEMHESTEDGDRDGHDETPLADDVAAQVTAAAEAAVPGGTVTKVEQEDTGFEAHVTDADGNDVEVYFDADMNVLETEPGH